jgi:hypothetical protein
VSDAAISTSTIDSLAPLRGEIAIAKGEFAKRRNVSPGRVSQWIAEKKIRPPAFDGEGRAARIFESVAVAQLSRRLDINQRLGNGLATNLAPIAAAPPAPQPAAVEAPIGTVVEIDAPAAPIEPTPAAPAESAAPLDQDEPRAPAPRSSIDEIGDAIRREQLEKLQRANRQERVKEAADNARLLDAIAVDAAQTKLAREMISAFEGALSDLATAVASTYKLPQRDVLHKLRGAWRDIRAKAAAAATIEAEAMPEMIEFEIAADAAPADHEN